MVSMLTLYRRHLKSCAIRTSRRSAEFKRAYTECDCTIWIYGSTDAGKVPRQTTGITDWKEAEEYRDSLLRGIVTRSRLSIKDACAAYLESKGLEVSQRTVSFVKTALDRFATFCARLGIVDIEHLTVDAVEQFKVKGMPEGMKGTSRAKTVERVRGFLRAAYRRGWTNADLFATVAPLRAVYEQKEPYTDDEVDRILDGALNIGYGQGGGTPGTCGHGYASAPGTFRALLELMLETGMRVGDAVAFDPEHLSRGERSWIYSYYPQKQRTDKPRKILEAYISERLYSKIQACKWLSPDRPFWYGVKVDRSITGEVWARMQWIGNNYMVDDCRPHRLRDTFAVRALSKGMHLEDVSRLLGHSSVKITETYYAKWVASRKLRLESIVADTLMDADNNALRDRKSNVLSLSVGKRGNRNNARLGSK